MSDLDFAAMLVSRVCHDLVSPVGAVVNGLEVLEDERDATMRADALKLVASSAALAAARPSLFIVIQLSVLFIFIRSM